MTETVVGHNKQIHSESTPLAVIGLGYVGLPLAILADRKGYSVLGIDVDKQKVDMIIRKECPFVDDVVSKHLLTSALDVSEDPSRIHEVDIIIICVPTPIDEHAIPDLRPVMTACTAVAEHLKFGQLVIIESTINPGVCEEVVIPTIEKVSGKKCGEDFYLAHCPERINPGDSKWNVSNIARVVGGYDQTSLVRAASFYESIIDAPIKRMGSLKEAEAVKVVENSFRDVNIAFVNELAMSFSKLGIDVVNVIDGASTKPFAFMPHYPGTGVGGHCIPVDPYYLIDYAKRNGFEHKFLSIARTINSGMPTFTVDLLEQELLLEHTNIKGTKVAVLRLSYKPNVGDLRESPSIKIISELQSRGAEVAVHDPYISQFKGAKSAFKVKQLIVFHENVSLPGNDEIFDTIGGADAVIVATAHDQYMKIAPANFVSAGIKIVVDGRNCLNKEDITAVGLIYRGIGR